VSESIAHHMAMGALSARLLIAAAATGLTGMVLAAAAEPGSRSRFGAVPMMVEEEERNFLVPRYFQDVSVPELVKRDGSCASDKHPCESF
jgi:hypothetical protein